MTREETIQGMVRTIVSRFHPEKIILFGSSAKGEGGADSDIDLLVVMRVEGSKRKKAAEIDAALAERSVPLDLIVITPEDMENGRNQPEMLIGSALKEGKTLYDRAA